jgi:hypothetical protein
MKVLATRKSEEGYKVRRLLLDDGKTKEWTIEVPLSVWKGAAPRGKSKARAQGHARAISRAIRKALGVEQIQKGIKPAAIANDLGVATNTVERWRRELNV